MCGHGRLPMRGNRRAVCEGGCIQHSWEASCGCITSVAAHIQQGDSANCLVEATELADVSQEGRGYERNLAANSDLYAGRPVIVLASLFFLVLRHPLLQSPSPDAQPRAPTLMQDAPATPMLSRCNMENPPAGPNAVPTKGRREMGAATVDVRDGNTHRWEHSFPALKGPTSLPHMLFLPSSLGDPRLVKHDPFRKGAVNFAWAAPASACTAVRLQSRMHKPRAMPLCIIGSFSSPPF